MYFNRNINGNKDGKKFDGNNLNQSVLNFSLGDEF
jgi:hypothetical protein